MWSRGPTGRTIAGWSGCLKPCGQRAAVGRLGQDRDQMLPFAYRYGTVHYKHQKQSPRRVRFRTALVSLVVRSTIEPVRTRGEISSLGSGAAFLHCRSSRLCTG